MPRATVAYESAAEARRKLKAVKPLRWHRQREGLYTAKGVRGAYSLLHRSPDRRKGVFPWVVTAGGMRGPEIKGGGFDTKSEGQTFASQYDAGLCGAPAVVIQAPPEGLPPGVYRGTAAGERKRTHSSFSSYELKVEAELKKMGVEFYSSTVDESEEFLARMDKGGIDPAVAAAVLVATKDHRHVHDCPERHVELAEGASEARRGKRESHFFRGQRFDIFSSDGSWWFETASGTGRGGFPSKEAAWAGAQQALGMPSGFSMAVEGGGAAAEARRKKRGLAPDDWMIPSLQQRLDQGQPGLGAYPTVNWAPFHIYYTHSDGKPTDKYQTGPDARGALRNFRLEGHKERVTKIVAVTLTSDGPKDVNHPDFVYNISDADTLEETGAAESKRRMPQPDPSSGFYVTRSSLTRSYFLMRGKQLIGEFSSRDEAMKEAERLGKE